jgi:DNA polymerase-3 subunit gamma/tau
MKATRTVHTALYRTYRPQTFKDVRGQEHIVAVLEAAIAQGKIAHAYLFAGTRGTGKTSVARIFAREIGCTDKDLYEIDAASNRGIDDIRELREGVHVVPFESPYKVYIVDEAHMLTKEAFNALLKTLEEPPSHAVFILATTERHKVPDTIQSRCDVYSFKQPSRALLAETVSTVAKNEGYTLEQSAADLIALLAEGSFRDALGTLQKVLTISKNKKVEVAEVEAVTGAPTGVVLGKLLAGLDEGDIDGTLSALAEASAGNMDARMLAKLLIHRVRGVLLLRHAPDLRAALEAEFPTDVFADMKERAERKETKITSGTLRVLLEAHATMAYATLPYLPLELSVVDLLSNEKESS